jgi:hypothetical protein
MLKATWSDYVIKEHILKNAVILIDTREQENSHIISYLDKKEIKHQSVKLSYGDYGLLIPKNEIYGFMQDVVLDFAIERKGSLEELSGNFTNDRDRIEHELWRGNGKLDLLVENGSIDDIIAKNYNTQYDKNSFIATLCSFHHRYNIGLHFCKKENSGYMIVALLKYKLREELKGD